MGCSKLGCRARRLEGIGDNHECRPQCSVPRFCWPYLRPCCNRTEGVIDPGSMLESNLIARQHIQRSKCQIFHMHPRIHTAYLTAARIGRSPTVTFISVFLGLMHYSISSVNGISRYSMCGGGSSNHLLVKIEAYTSTTWTRMTSLSQKPYPDCVSCIAPGGSGFTVIHRFLTVTPSPAAPALATAVVFTFQASPKLVSSSSTTAFFVTLLESASLYHALRPNCVRKQAIRSRARGGRRSKYFPLIVVIPLPLSVR